MRWLPLFVVLSGCATPGAPEGDYRAVGTEPFWSLTISADRIRLDELNHGLTDIRTPDAESARDGRRYVSPDMTVDVTHARCSDGMSDRVYPDTVVVRLAGRTLRGCGGLTWD